MTRSREFLQQYAEVGIYHPPLADETGRLVGNNGDRLILAGTQRIYKDLGVKLVDRPEDAGLIVIGGNGGMIETFKVIPGIFRRYCQEYPNTPLCVLPSSFYYPTRPLAEDIGQRSAPVVLFCRERISYDHLLHDHGLPEFCSVELDHDHAFELAGTELVTRLSRAEPKHVLMVERGDIEHPFKSVIHVGSVGRWRKVIPERLKTPLRSIVGRARGRKRTAFSTKCETLLREFYPEYFDWPRVVRDSSDNRVVDFEQFCMDIAEAAVVFTTRLHVGILAALLGKPTFLFEGSYHKIRGVYEFSLASYSNVRLISRHELVMA